MYLLYLYVNISAMETKLTLRLNKGVIERAKIFAQNHNISLSKMIEAYLESLTTQNDDKVEISPLVKSLSGVIDLDEGFEYKKSYSQHLDEKYK